MATGKRSLVSMESGVPVYMGCRIVTDRDRLTLYIPMGAYCHSRMVSFESCHRYRYFGTPVGAPLFNAM